MACTLQVEPGYRTDALDPGRVTKVYRGASAIWTGQMTEPVPTVDGWQVSAIGVGSLSNNFCAIWANAPYSLDEPVKEAIQRGLPWTDVPGGITSGWLETAPDMGSLTVTDHMNNITAKYGQVWSVARNGQLSIGNIPANANRLLTSTAPVPRTLFGMCTTAFLYYCVSDDGNGNTAYATTCVFNQAAINQFGPNETYVDLSSMTVNGTNNVISQAQAQQVGTYLLNNYQQANWAGPFVAQPGDLMTMGGVGIDLATEQAGSVVRLMVTDAPFGGQVVAGAIEFVVGAYSYDDDAQTATLTPLKAYNTDLSTLLSNAVTWQLCLLTS